MRRLALALYLMLAVRGAATSCVTVRHDHFYFFGEAESVFFARAEVRMEEPHLFRADEILRGTMKLGEAVSVQRSACSPVKDGERYLVVRLLKCDPSTDCVRFADPSQTAALLHYLANAHPEYHEEVIAKVLRWHRGEISLAELAEWIDTVAVRPRSEEDDEVVLWLASELRDIISELRFFAEQFEGDDAFARPLLEEAVRAMETFPPGSAADFDARAAAQGEDAPRREEVEDELGDAIARVRKSAEWRSTSAEADVAERRKQVPPQ